MLAQLAKKTPASTSTRRTALRSAPMLYVIARIEIRDVSSAFAMEQIKYTTELPLDYMVVDNQKSGDD